MYVAVYALLTAAGGWIAWRNNPMNSNRSTLRFFAIASLTVTAYVAAMIAAVDLTAGRSVVVAFATLCFTALIGTLALIAVIVKGSTPAAPPPPSPVRLVNVYRARLRPWAARFAWTMLGFVLLAAVLPGDWKAVALSFGAIAAYIGVNVLAAGYLSARGYDRSLTGVEAEPWLHWTCAPQEWKAWIEVEPARIPVAPQLLLNCHERYADVRSVIFARWGIGVRRVGRCGRRRRRVEEHVRG